MALIVPDSVSPREVIGSVSEFILYFTTQVITDGDTVNVAGLLSNVIHASLTPSDLKPGTGVDLSAGAGTTLTLRVSAGTPKGRLVIRGTP